MNVIERIRLRASEFAEAPAIVQGDRVWTHAELWDRVDRLSAGLRGLGVGKGTVVMAWLPNSHEAIESELAVLQIGAVWVTLNKRLTWFEVAGVIASTQPKIVITDAEGLKAVDPSEAMGAAPPLESIQWIAVGDPRDDPTGNDGTQSYEDLIDRSEAERPRVQIEESDIARLRYTSGTTGEAKAAIIPHRIYLASLDNLEHELAPVTSDDRVLHAAPLTHASGALLYPILAAGGANVVQGRFEAEGTLEAIEKWKITTLFAVPTMLQRMAASPGFEARDLGSLRAVFYGGAPMSLEKLRPLLDRIGPALIHIYGMTEAPWPITTLRHGDHDPKSPKFGSAGRSTTVCEIEIADDAGNPLAPGKIGEIRVRGRNVMDGYWNDPEATDLLLRDGWLSTGDLGRLDSEGYLYIVDRKKDLIITGGFNVYPAEVERALAEHEKVAEAAVVGVPHPDWGEQVVAYIVASPGAELSRSEIAEWCAHRLSDYKRPKRIEIVDGLPKTPSGKILKKALAAGGG